MIYFHLISSAFVILTSIIFVFKGKNKNALKPSLLFYSIIYSVYLGISPFINRMLLEEKLIEDFPSYIKFYLLTLTALSILSALIMLILCFVKTDKTYNYYYNAFILVITGAYIAMALSLILRHREYLFMIAFIPLHYILPIVVLTSALLNQKIVSQKIKILIAFTLLSLFSVFGIVQVVSDAIKFNSFNFTFIMIALILTITAFFGLINAIIKIRDKKNEQ